MSIKYYPSGVFQVKRLSDVRAMSIYDNCLHVRDNRFLRIVSMSVYMSISWVPDEILQDSFRKLFGSVEMSKDNGNFRSEFVMNNLSDDLQAELDDNYPSLDAIDVMFTDAVDVHNCVITARKDKAGYIVVFLNQGNYAVSGYSDTMIDALVIALYKLQLCSFDLSSKAQGQATGRRRG